MAIADGSGRWGGERGGGGQPAVLDAAQRYDALVTDKSLHALSPGQLADLQASHLRILAQLQRAGTQRLKELKHAARRGQHPTNAGSQLEPQR